MSTASSIDDLLAPLRDLTVEELDERIIKAEGELKLLRELRRSVRERTLRERREQLRQEVKR